jgi:hypothetical protein
MGNRFRVSCGKSPKKLNLPEQGKKSVLSDKIKDPDIRYH